MVTDLHMHSQISDGTDTIKHLIKKALKRGLQGISITDHDTVEGQRLAQAEAAAMGIEYIPGIEISAFDPVSGTKVHILGYDFDLEAENIKKLCAPTLEKRHQNTIRQIEIIGEAGYPVREQEVWEEVGHELEHNRCLYKQHIMAVLRKKGFTDSIYSPLYKRLFKKGGIAAQDIAYVSYQEAIKAILEDGGVPVLAHPGQEKLYPLVADMVTAGLRGIEIHHPDHNPEDINLIEKLGEQYNLLLTGGSDYHGSYGAEDLLGLVRAPDFSLQNIREAHRKQVKC